MNINKDLLKLTAPTRKSFISSIISGIVASLFTVLLALFLAKAINGIFLENKSVVDVKPFLILFLFSAVLKAFFIWFEKKKISVVVLDIKTKLREEIMGKLLADDSSGILQSSKSGELSNTLLKGIDTLDKYFSEYLPQLFLSALTPLLILFFVFPLDLISGIVFLVTAPLIPFLMFLIGTSAEELNKKQWKALSRMSGYFLDVLQGILTIKIFGQAQNEIKRIKEISLEFKNSTLKVLKIAFLSALVLELLSTISIAIIAVEIGLRLMYGNMEFENALFILILAPEFYLPLRQLGARYHAGLEGIAAFNSITKLLELKAKKNSQTGTREVFSLGNIELRNISFKYKNRDENALNNISCLFEIGKTTAVIGESGSGKSTLIKLLMHFEKKYDGEVLLNNINSNLIDEDEWYKNISWISQTPHIFHKTIYENIAMAKNNATEEEVYLAAKRAFVHETIINFENGYDTIVGERASTLSGGEIQRIAFARAFLKNSPIVIMDEPTSSIDMIVENELINSMKLLFKNKTVIIAAHRLNTIRNADKIILLEKGQIIGEGKHEFLIKENVSYQNLFNTFRREM